MGPINIRYHVISLAAVFLALGMGILVGSNTNFFGITSLIDKQNSVIERLENNYREMRRETREIKSTLGSTEQYVKLLEDTVVPRLYKDRLTGIRLGSISVGCADESATETVFFSQIKHTGANVLFKMRLSEQGFDSIATATPDFFNLFSAELIGMPNPSYKPVSKPIAREFINEGAVIEGGFGGNVDGVVVSLCPAVSEDFIEDRLIPLEKSISAKGGMVLNVAYEKNARYKERFTKASMAYNEKIDGLPGQVEAITYIEDTTGARNQGDGN